MSCVVRLVNNCNLFSLDTLTSQELIIIPFLCFCDLPRFPFLEKLVFFVPNLHALPSQNTDDFESRQQDNTSLDTYWKEPPVVSRKE